LRRKIRSFVGYAFRMTNYYPLLASVVATLDPNTAEARRQLYDSARVGFPTYLGKPRPAALRFGRHARTHRDRGSDPAARSRTDEVSDQ